MNTESLLHFVPSFFFFLVLFQRTSEVALSLKHSGRTWRRPGIHEINHIVPVLLFMFVGSLQEPIFQFWFLLLYLLSQIIRALDLKNQGSKWELGHPFRSRYPGLVIASEVAQNFALPFSFGYWLSGFVIGTAGVLVSIWYGKKGLAK